MASEAGTERNISKQRRISESRRCRSKNDILMQDFVSFNKISKYLWFFILTIGKKH